MLSYTDDAVDYPGMHGTGFFVDLDGRLFLLTARHCLGKLGEDLSGVAGRLLIPAAPVVEGQPAARPSYVPFESVGRAVVTDRLDEFVGHEEGDLDVVALTVGSASLAVTKEVRARSVRLPPDGGWFEKALARFADDGKEPVFRLRGFPKQGTSTEFDYDARRIVVQGATLLGRHTGIGPYPHTHRLRVFDEAPVADSDGMSGGPVYMRVSGADEERFALVGMVLGGKFSDVFFATVPWLTAAGRSSLAKP